MRRRFRYPREKGRDVVYVVLVIIAALLAAGLLYLRGRRA
jgi:hypothetical protein